jgi:putative membrane protein
MTMHWGWDAGGWLMMGIGMLLWLLLLVAVVWIAVRTITAADRRQADGQGDRDEALDLLRRRFASGEIDAEEYERRRTLLQQ